MRSSDWSSDVCSSDLAFPLVTPAPRHQGQRAAERGTRRLQREQACGLRRRFICGSSLETGWGAEGLGEAHAALGPGSLSGSTERSEEHTSDIQSLMSISYAVYSLNKKTTSYLRKTNIQNTT